MEGFLSTQDLEQIFTEENEDGFLLKEYQEKLSHPNSINENSFDSTIINKTIHSDQLKGKKIHGTKFINCLFLESDISDLYAFMCTFESCDFVECNLEGAVFRKCDIQLSIFSKCHSRFLFNLSEGYIYNTLIDECTFTGIEISGTYAGNLIFRSSSISWGRFQVLITSNFDDRELALNENLKIAENDLELIFESCKIEFMNFMMNNFIDAVFKNCLLSRNNFNDCILYNHNFKWTKKKETIWGVNNLDIVSLLNSQLINNEILEQLFHFKSKIQIDIKDNMTKKKLSSVFISYSLKDHEVAEEINARLKTEGVKTFLWEKDAPGGKKLKSIMKTNIDSKDRILFISSENSLKSQACHFEITQGRKKQNKSWKTILYPIHLDNLLFEIEQEQIPLDYRDEYWKNITELKEINSMDFSMLKKRDQAEESKIDELFNNLINSLKIE